MASQLLAQQRMITGTVTDANSNTLLPYAVVYINNTSNATETDSMGKYQLRNAFYQQRGGSVELVVSSLGYTTFRQKITYGLQDTLILNIGLMPSPQTITEVAVKGKRDQKWLKQYKKFESTFIGTNQNAGSTKILNPWVIDFTGEVSAFSATAQNILEVENKALASSVPASNLPPCERAARGASVLRLAPEVDTQAQMNGHSRPRAGSGLQ